MSSTASAFGDGHRDCSGLVRGGAAWRRSSRRCRSRHRRCPIRSLFARLRNIFGFLARATLNVLFPIAKSAAKAGIGLLALGRNRLFHRAARVLVIVELDRCGAMRLANVGVARKMVWQCRETDREIITIAQSHANSSVGSKWQCAPIAGGAAFWRFLILPKR